MKTILYALRRRSTSDHENSPVFYHFIAFFRFGSGFYAAESYSFLLPEECDEVLEANESSNLQTIVLHPPHATRYGFDPYNGEMNWKQNFPSPDDDEFIQWAKIPKSTKFGWDLFQEWLLAEEISKRTFRDDQVLQHSLLPS